MKRFYLFLQAVLLIALISCEPIEPGGETAKDYWLQTFTVTAAESGDLLFSTVTDETLFVDYKTEISDSDFVKPLADASEAKDLACVQFQDGSSKFFVPFSTEDLKSGNGNSTVSGISLTAEGSFNAGDNFTYKLKAASESNADIYKSIEVRRKPTSFLIGYVMRDAGRKKPSTGILRLIRHLYRLRLSPEWSPGRPFLITEERKSKDFLSTGIKTKASPGKRIF